MSSKESKGGGKFGKFGKSKGLPKFKKPTKSSAKSEAGAETSAGEVAATKASDAPSTPSATDDLVSSDPLAMAAARPPQDVAKKGESLGAEDEPKTIAEESTAPEEASSVELDVAARTDGKTSANELDLQRVAGDEELQEIAGELEALGEAKTVVEDDEDDEGDEAKTVVEDDEDDEGDEGDEAETVVEDDEGPAGAVAPPVPRPPAPIPSIATPTAKPPGAGRQRSDATSPLPKEALADAPKTTPSQRAEPSEKVESVGKAKPTGKAKPKPTGAPTVKMAPLFAAEGKAPAGKAKSARGVGAETLPPPPGYVPPAPPPMVEKPKPPLPTASTVGTTPPPLPTATAPKADPYAATQAMSGDVVANLREVKRAAEAERAKASAASPPTAVVSSAPISSSALARAPSLAEEAAAADAAIADLEGLGEVETIENSFVGPIPTAPASVSSVSGHITSNPGPPSGQMMAAGPPSGQMMAAGPPSGQMMAAGPPSGQMMAAGPPSGQMMAAGPPSGQMMAEPGYYDQAGAPPPAFDPSFDAGPAGAGSQQFPVPGYPATHGQPPQQSAEDRAREASWKVAHPSARKWAQKRETGSGRRSPNPIRIAAGLFMIAIGIYLLAIFIPDHEPSGAGEEVASTQVEAERGWRFSESQHSLAAGIAFGFLALGLFAGIHGATYRKAVHTRCGRCDMEVEAVRDAFVYKCLNGGHRAGLQLAAIVLVGGFFALGIGFLGLFLTAS